MASRAMAEEPPAKKVYGGEEWEDPAVTRFREYLRIPTVSGLEDASNANYDIANKFLLRMAEEIGLPCKLVEVHPGRVVVVMTWEGTRPELKSIMFNSHIDVVPVFPEHWSFDPFAAHKRENGDIVARGTQDMKCCGMWYLEAIRRLKATGKRFPRTIYITFVPDEEVGSLLGMELFVQHEEFKQMNIGFGLDEGLASPTDIYRVFYGERSAWWFTVTCPGNPGHGSRFIENTAANKVRKIVNSFLSFRDSQLLKLNSDPNLTIGDVTCLNITRAQGGVQYNVVPSEMSIGVDIRVTPTDNEEEMLSKLQKWVQDAGEGCTISWYAKNPHATVTSTDPSSPWWRAFSGVCDKRGMKLQLEIAPCGTDVRYLRRIGLPAIGFSPMVNTPVLLHDHDEFLNEKVFLAGIEIYEEIISAVASVEDTE